MDAPLYVYGVVTFGASVGEWEKQFRDAVHACGLEATATFPVKMVDTYVPLFDVTNTEKNNKILKQAEELIPHIAESIRKKAVCLQNETNGRKMNSGKIPHWMAKWQYKYYERARRTKRFSVESPACRHCGACAANCPTRCIEMRTDELLPVWTKEMDNIPDQWERKTKRNSPPTFISSPHKGANRRLHRSAACFLSGADCRRNDRGLPR